MTSQQTLTLTEFLLARIAEDATLAQGTADYGRRRNEHEFGDPDELIGFARGYEPDDGWLTVGAGRVLAECEAKQRIVELHSAEQVGFGPEVLGCATCDATMPETWGPDLLQPGASLYPCETVCLLAQPYADHPDYRDEWRP